MKQKANYEPHTPKLGNSIMSTVSLSKDSETTNFNLLDYPICFAPPLRVAVSAWIGHVPFAFYLVAALRPKAIVELGTHYGVSYCAFCQAVKELEIDTRCYAIDTWQGDAQTGFYDPEVLNDLKAHHDPLYGGFSRLIQSTFDESLNYFTDGTFDLLHIDGFHTYEAVKQDFEKWLPKMSERGVVLFHDINVRERNFGVWKFWEEIKLGYPHFEFIHSHGLGILSVGQLYPRALKELFECPEEEAVKIREAFYQLGARLEATQELQTLRQSNKELAVSSKELAVSSKELREKEQQLQQKDTQIHERNLQLISQAEQLQEKDNQIQERDSRLQERDTSIHEKNLQLLAHVEQMREKESLLDKKSVQIQASDLQLRLRERQLQFKIEQLQEKERSEQEKDQQLLEKDLQISAKDLQLSAINRQLQVKEIIIHDFIKLAEDFNRSGSYKLGRALSWPYRLLKQQLAVSTNENQLTGMTSQPHGHQHQPEKIITALSQIEPEQFIREEDAAYDYKTWVESYDTLSDSDREAILTRIDKLEYKPLLSIVMPVYNVEEIWLRTAIESVRKQLYPQWELCIADDNSSQPHVRKVLEEYARKDSRIKIVFRRENGHISAASNSALELTSGEFVALLDNDDELSEHALYMVVEELNEHPKPDLIYSDEDKISEKGERYEPHFKSEWNPDLFYSCNTISHLGVYRTSIIKKIGGFREGYEGSQDYDLALRFIEQIPEGHIRHIPHVLYHWRAISGSVALASGEKNYAHEAARKAIRSHFERKGIEAIVTEGHNRFHRVVYPVPSPAPLVSLIVATRDRVELLRQTIYGLLNETDYQAIEIVIIDNQSSDPATLSYLRDLQRDSRVKIIQYNAPFNYSVLNNLGVRESKGEIVGLINNDIKVISPEWLKEMVSHAIRPGIGIVGAKLLYPDDTVQHAGVILGVNGVAAHVHKFIPRNSTGYFNRAMIIQNLSAITGACMLLRRKVFDEVGGLDEVNLPVAFNDVDLCIRIRERGYRIVWTPYAELYHLESASRGSDHTPENKPRFIKEIEYMRSVWSHILPNDPYYNPNLTLTREDFSLAVPPRTIKRWC